MSCNDLRCWSTTTHSNPIGNTTQPIARSNPTGTRTRCDRRPATPRRINGPKTGSFSVHNGFAENRYPTPGARMTIGTAGK